MLTITSVRVPSAFDNYIRVNKETELVPALKDSLKQFRKLFKNISSKQSNTSYAEGKWTLKELLQHMIDAERVFVYRAVRFARKDTTPLPSFDENAWAANSMASHRKWKEMVDEFELLRKSSITFFESLNAEQLNQTGIASGNEMNVVGLGFVTAGHSLHHCKIIKERYVPAMR
jgi:hypothetical protein